MTIVDMDEAAPYANLYDILEICTNNELAPLVDVLIKAPVSFLKISRAFERHHPDHIKYTDQIGDEIYRISLAILGRTDGKRPSYGDMIAGLCKQIGIPVTSNDTNGNEGLLLNTFSKQHLSSLPPANRQQLVNEACDAASTAAAGMLSSGAWPPFASVLLQVAYLRRKFAEEGRLPGRKPEHVTGNVPTLVDNEADALVVQTEDGHPILTLATLPDTGSGVWRGPDSSRKAMNALTPILKAVQPYLSAEQMLKSGDYVRVTLPPGGVLTFSKKLGHHVGVAKGHKGLLRLDPISAVSLASPAALLTLASAMAEQKKLEDIEKSLDEIKSSLKDVSKFQQNERRSVLTGSIRYFQQVAASVLHGELASEVLHEIERHEVELVRVQEHLTEDIRTQIAALSAIKKEGWGSGKYVKAIQDVQDSLDKLYDEALLCIRARACGYQLLCAYPGREAGKKARFEDISGALNIFSPTGETTIFMDRVLREKIQGSSSYDVKALLLTKENALFDTIMAQSAIIIESLRDAGRELEEQVAPISIDVKMEDGSAVAVRMS